MSDDNFVYINPGPVGNPSIQNLNRIICPSCNREYLKPSRKTPGKLLCEDFQQCCYETTEEELKKEEKYIPQDMGTFYSKKPYLNQTNANRNYLGPLGDEQGIHLIDTESDYEKCQKYKLTNMGKPNSSSSSGSGIQGQSSFMSLNNRSGKKVDQKTLDVIKKVANSDTAQIVDVSLY